MSITFIFRPLEASNCRRLRRISSLLARSPLEYSIFIPSTSWASTCLNDWNANKLSSKWDIVRGRKKEMQGRRLNEAMTVEDKGLPAYRLHPLKGKPDGFWSVTVSGNCRIIFRFESGSAYDVDPIGYH
jgi:proteic killer suppression protein